MSIVGDILGTSMFVRNNMFFANMDVTYTREQDAEIKQAMRDKGHKPMSFPKFALTARKASRKWDTKKLEKFYAYACNYCEIANNTLKTDLIILGREETGGLTPHVTVISRKKWDDILDHQPSF